MDSSRSSSTLFSWGALAKQNKEERERSLKGPKELQEAETEEQEQPQSEFKIEPRSPAKDNKPMSSDQLDGMIQKGKSESGSFGLPKITEEKVSRETKELSADSCEAETSDLEISENSSVDFDGVEMGDSDLSSGEESVASSAPIPIRKK